jgi:hypothetical protein
MALMVRSCLIDGEVVICDERGVAVFDRLRHGPRAPYRPTPNRGSEFERLPICQQLETLFSVGRTEAHGLPIPESRLH